MEKSSEILERISDAFVALDNKWCYTYMNKKAGEIFSRDPANMIGKHIWTEFPEGIGQPFHKAYLKAMAEQKYVHLEEYYPPYDLWFENHIYPSQEGLSIYFKDITSRKKKENEVLQKEGRFRSLLENNEGIISIIDKDLNVFYRSSSSARITGWEHHELEKTNAKEFIHPDDAERVYKVILEAIETPAISILFSCKVKHKNGHYLWMEGSAKNLLNDPNVGGIVINLRDVSERKIAEEISRISQERLNYHLNNTPLGVIEWDKNLIIQKWSPRAEQIFGWSESEVIGKHFNDFNLVNEGDAAYIAIVAEELMSGKILQNDTTNKNNTKSGKVICNQWFNSVLKDENGKISSIMSLVLDVSDRKKAEEEVKKTTEELRELTSYLQNVREDERMFIAREIHDELGQQLTGLKMDTDWLLKKSEKNDSSIKEKLTGMNSLIDETIKTVRRISTELRPSILDDLGLIAAIEWQAEDFKKRTGIRTAFETTLSSFLGERNLNTNIFRVLQEVLTNIARHANASLVNITFEEKNEQLILRIRDNGVGFDINEIKDKKTLGLLGMKERAHMFKGELFIRSEKQKGTEITFSLPMNIKK